MQAAGLVSLLALMLAPAVAVTQNPRPRQAEVEASANLDADDVEPVLQRLSSLVSSGFSAHDAHILAIQIAAQPVRTEETHMIGVTFAGHRAAIRVVVWKDDPQAYNIYFFTAPDLAAALNRAIAAHMAAVGK